MIPHDDALRCSNDTCGRNWLPADGEPLPLTPVTEQLRSGDRRWHPCPECLRESFLLASLSHGLRERTAIEIASIGA